VGIVCLDLEGVLVPEVWIEFAEITGITELRATTRDYSDYDELMRMRLAQLDKHSLGLNDIQKVIAKITPLEGAKAFLDTLRESHQVVILSDTYYEFAQPLMQQLGMPTLFCHQLEVDANQRIVDYHIRLKDHKRLAVEAFQQLNFNTVAAGDSYNDTSMLAAADKGILFNAPQNVVDDFPQFILCHSYDELQAEIHSFFSK
jgi:phosphoserine/homoserine phosphotransferase